MEATIMKLTGLITAAALSLTLVAAAPVFAQEQHEDAKPAQEEKKTQPDKATKPEEKPAAQQEKNAKPAEKNTKANTANRIPADKYKASFGQQHTFRVSQSDYRNHRFQYGGYSFGFVDPWPSNWLYTQNVYVVEIDGMYYLCNASYPGVNLTLSFTM
jgi:hypothetical protein